MRNRAGKAQLRLKPFAFCEDDINASTLKYRAQIVRAVLSFRIGTRVPHILFEKRLSCVAADEAANFEQDLRLSGETILSREDHHGRHARRARARIRRLQRP